MGLFKNKEKVEAPPANTPDMIACNQLFADICGIMYEKRRTILELEIVLGMLQSEIIMNKTSNAINAQVGRLAFLPPPMLMPVDDEEVEDIGAAGQHYQ